MLKTRLTDMLGIRHPIILGGMMWLGRAELAAAVSNAGGLGIITALTFGTGAGLRDEIRKLRALTDKPFGVNISMLPIMGGHEAARPFIDVLCEERVPLVETSGQNPEPFVAQLHAAGVRLMHKVPAVRFAQKAEQIGADLVAVVGFECGGHPGNDDVPTSILVARAVDALKIPVIAAGGIADGRGVAAALALGASGVLVGTRFMATRECAIHEAFKKWLLEADERKTVIIERTIKNPARVLDNAAARKVLELEARGASLGELMGVIAGHFGQEAYESGNIDLATVACGQGVGLIHDMPTCAELVERMVREAEERVCALHASIAS
jgi:nitronate monooxygenase